MTDRLTHLVQLAQTEYSAKALWWMRNDLDPAQQWPVVVRALRTHGGHSGMLLAEEIEEAGHAAHQLPA